MTMEYKLAGRDGRGRRWSPGTPESRAWEVVYQMAAQAKAKGVTTQWRARDTGKPAKGAPALSARPFSVFEVKRQYAEYIETIAHNLSQELGLMSPPPVRWFYAMADGTRHEPGWKAITTPLAPGNTLCGFFDPGTRELWLKSDLPYEDEIRVLRHELRHAWQHDTYGPSYYALGPAVAEADATAYGEKYR